jgi:hypothetical protein
MSYVFSSELRGREEGRKGGREEEGRRYKRYVLH